MHYCGHITNIKGLQLQPLVCISTYGFCVLTTGVTKHRTGPNIRLVLDKDRVDVLQYENMYT